MQGSSLNGIRCAVSQIAAGEKKTTWSNRVHRTIQSSAVKRDVDLKQTGPVRRGGNQEVKQFQYSMLVNIRNFDDTMEKIILIATVFLSHM